mmetsp:Transcript_3572/g.13676  ORF Transcript_3572/g.13676 Transcript_3572/m.13676 type:complete len:100 (+) Transcript_3572:128-427(+)
MCATRVCLAVDCVCVCGGAGHPLYWKMWHAASKYGRQHTEDQAFVLLPLRSIPQYSSPMQCLSCPQNTAPAMDKILAYFCPLNSTGKLPKILLPTGAIL